MDALRDASSEIRSRNAVVFGISTDTVESHKGFHEKEHLNFPLLADPGKTVTQAYGVLGPRGFANRVTFLIGPDGTIRGIDRDVNSQFSRNGDKLTTRHGQLIAAALAPWKARLGAPVPAFWLPDAAGKTVSLYQPGKKATVVLFTGARDRGAGAAERSLAGLAADPAYREVAFMAFDPVPGETAAQIQAHAAEAKLPFPVARDASGRIAAQFGVTVLPTVWVLDANGTSVYSGLVEGPGAYVKEALDAVLAGRAVTTAQTTPRGARLRRSRR